MSIQFQRTKYEFMQHRAFAAPLIGNRTERDAALPSCRVPPWTLALSFNR